MDCRAVEIGSVGGAEAEERGECEFIGMGAGRRSTAQAGEERERGGERGVAVGEDLEDEIEMVRRRRGEPEEGGETVGKRRVEES